MSGAEKLQDKNEQSLNNKAAVDRRPHFAALGALLAVAGLHEAIPPSLAFHPRWVLFGLVSLLLVPTAIAHAQGKHKLNRILSFTLSSVVAAAMIRSLIVLIRAIPAHVETPEALLRSAAALWVTNILVFAVWYYRLDAGGPDERARHPGHDSGAFLFPQMTRSSAHSNWEPNFVDYLFLSFNASTALSPTDTAVLSRWAKVLMMLQAMISLCVVVLLAARAVNIL